MNYIGIYNRIIGIYRQNPPDKKKRYCEEHHIIPRSFGGPDVPENIVTLPVRAHIFCHELLFMYWKSAGDDAKAAKMAWALKRFALGKARQKKDIRHCFRSKVFAKAIEFGKKMQKSLRWITDGESNDQIFFWETPPEGWHWGMKKLGRRKNKWITNGIENMRVYQDDPVPEGWHVGISRAEDYKPMWITDGIVDRRIPFGKPIPDGWRHGISRARNDGMQWIHKKDVPVQKGNCVQIRKGDPIPEGWEIGYGQKWSTKHKSK